MSIRSYIARSRAHALLLAGACILALAAVPTFASPNDPVSSVDATVDAQVGQVGTEEVGDLNTDDGQVGQQGVDEADGQNNNTDDGQVGQQGVDEPDGQNNNTDDGQVGQQGVDEPNGQNGNNDQPNADQTGAGNTTE